MKSIYKLAAFSALFILSSCERDLPRMLHYRSYAFTDLDPEAGSWKTVLDVSSVKVEAPAEVTSAAYQQELTQLKADQKNITPKQKEAIDYWTSNPVNRWNEIALDIITKYNLIPGPNEDGTYTLPNASNPAGPPPFPFAHPPYASRALSYLSVAQFDGLILAWKYKYQYGRPAPYKADGGITYAYEKDDLPSYPADGAVVAEASRAILSAMFPLEVLYLQSMADQHLESVRLAGGAVKSDVEAGMKIGREVAAIALQRAANDGMKNAQAPKAVSDSLKTAAYKRFGWAWDNLEIPVRPVGLTPLFGKVKMWSIEKPELVRPGMPPALDSEKLKEDMKILQGYSDSMNEVYRRIANYWEDGLGKYTPPGHWNRIAKEYIVQYKMNPIRTARVYAYLNMAVMDAGVSCWDTKYYYHYPRPIQLMPKFRTILGTPNFPAYTSGHSVFSGAAAEVLAYVFPNEAALMRNWAEEAAVSRLYGGIHWTFDATVGTEQGKNVASYTLNRARADGAD
jgi:hypothetical protein